MMGDSYGAPPLALVRSACAARHLPRAGINRVNDIALLAQTANLFQGARGARAQACASGATEQRTCVGVPKSPIRAGAREHGAGPGRRLSDGRRVPKVGTSAAAAAPLVDGCVAGDLFGRILEWVAK